MKSKNFKETEKIRINERKAAIDLNVNMSLNQQYNNIN